MYEPCRATLVAAGTSAKTMRILHLIAESVKRGRLRLDTKPHSHYEGDWAWPLSDTACLW